MDTFTQWEFCEVQIMEKKVLDEVVFLVDKKYGEYRKIGKQKSFPWS